MKINYNYMEVDDGAVYSSHCVFKLDSWKLFVSCTSLATLGILFCDKHISLQVSNSSYWDIPEVKEVNFYIKPDDKYAVSGLQYINTLGTYYPPPIIIDDKRCLVEWGWVA